MIEFIKQQDINFFLLINHLPHNLALDLFFGFITFLGFGGWIWFLFIFLLFLKKEIKKNQFLIFLKTWIFTILFEIFLKNLFKRPRPPFTLSEVILPFDFSSGFSFPSGHAILAFSLAYILSKLHKKFFLSYYLLAILIAFSRVYLGKHYPSDVLGGAFLGILIGVIFSKTRFSTQSN